MTTQACPPAVVPALLATIEPILHADERKRLYALIVPEVESSVSAEYARIVGAAKLTLIWTARVLRYADLPDYADVVTDEAGPLDGRRSTATYTLAALYRIVLARLPEAGPQMRDRIKDAVKALRASLDALHGCDGGERASLAVSGLVTAMEAAQQRDRKVWFKQVVESVEALSRKPVSMKQGELFGAE